MTGFGSATGETAGFALRAEIRSVNHRGLDVAAKVPPALAAFEPAVIKWCRGAFARGRIDVTIRSIAGSGTASNEAAIRERAATLRRLAAAAGVSTPLTVADLFLPGVLSTVAPSMPADEILPFDDAIWGSIAALLSAARAGVDATRNREGASLRTALSALLTRAESIQSAITSAYPNALEAFRERQIARLGSGDATSPVVAELALGRDATEELDRLASHFAAWRATLDDAGAVGRRLDILTTEMLREAATLTTKTPSAELAERAMDLRSELERLREQVQNLE